MKNNWKEEFDKRFELQQQGCMECGGDYLVDLNMPKGNGYFCEYDLSKIKDFIESLLAEQKKELAEKVDTELRRMLAAELPILEKKIREEQKKELMELFLEVVEEEITRNQERGFPTSAVAKKWVLTQLKHHE